MILLWSWELALESRSESEMPSRVKSLTVPRYACLFICLPFIQLNRGMSSCCLCICDLVTGTLIIQ